MWVERSNIKIKSMLKKNILKTFMVFVSVVSLVSCGARIAFALQYGEIKVADRGGNIVVNGNQFDGLTIMPDLVFNDLGDYISYELPFSSPDGSKYQILGVSDDNDSEYITSSYTYDETMSSDDKTVVVKLEYVKMVPFGEEIDLGDIHITVNIEEEGSTDPVEPVEPDDPVRPDDPVKPDESDDTDSDADDDKKETDIIVPDTGSNGSKYFGGYSQDGGYDISPYVIIGICSMVTIVILVIPRKHRMKFGGMMVLALATVISVGANTDVFAGETQVHLTIRAEKIKAMPEIDLENDVVTAYFPNIYNNKVQDRPANMAAGNAIILKTLDDKYVLIDTGPRTDDIRQVIYDKLRDLQGADDVRIDYLLISHLDFDHYGNAALLMSNGHIDVENVLVKHEIYGDNTVYSKENAFREIVTAAVNNDVNIITSDDNATVSYVEGLIGDGDSRISGLSEGMILNVGKFLKINVFNTANVYADKECPQGVSVGWTASPTHSRIIQLDNGEYVYFDGADYPNIELKTTTNPVRKPNGQGMNRYFYAYDFTGTHSLCASNPNSFAFLAEITTTGLKKYMYFANDIENAGYPIMDGGSNSAQILSDFTFRDGEFVSDITPYVIPSEINAANAVYDKLSNDAMSLGVSVDKLVNNIVVYQESHHGINNNEEAVNKLNLNRETGIYSILEDSDNSVIYENYFFIKTYFYTLKNIPGENKFRVGTVTEDGTNCSVDMVGGTNCAFYREN